MIQKKMVNSAAIVYVFFDDTEKSVSMEDVKEWLQIIDEVVEIKLQYDAVSKRTCFSVEFRRPTSAQQAVQYLNGSRFKNCVVTIKSRVYSAIETPSSSAETAELHTAVASAAPAPTTSSTAAPRRRCRECDALPCNHRLPADLQMDQLLLEHLLEASGAEGCREEVPALWSQLKTLQERLVWVYRELDEMKAQLTAADAQLTKQLHSQTAVPFDRPSNNQLREARVPVAFPLMSSRCVSHYRGIPCDAHTPSSVVNFITLHYGPIAFCSVSTHAQAFFLTLQFLFCTDEERFLACARTAESSPAHAKTALEKTALRLTWSPLNLEISPQDPAAFHYTNGALQSAVERLLA